MHICKYVYVHIFFSRLSITHVYKYILKYVYICMDSDVYICTDIFIHTTHVSIFYSYIFIYIYIHIYMHKFINMYTCTFKHT